MTVLLLLQLQTNVEYLVVMCFEQFMTMYVCKKGEGSLHAGPCFPHYYFHSRTFFSFQ